MQLPHILHFKGIYHNDLFQFVSLIYSVSAMRISVATGSGHPGHPGQPGHVLPGSTRSDLLYKISRILHKIM